MTRVRTERQAAVMSPDVAQAMQVLAETIAEVRTLAEMRATRPVPGQQQRR